MGYGRLMKEIIVKNPCERGIRICRNRKFLQPFGGSAKKADQQRTSYEKERQLLFANMAHDLRTPLTTIQGTAKAVADGLVSDDKLTQTMETIMSKTAHMNELVNRLLIFSKLESPDYQLHCQNLDLVELIREVLLEQLDVAEKIRST